MAESLEIVLLIVCALGCLYLAKMLFSSAANDDDAARLSRHNSGIDIVHGGKGNQSGRMEPDKRVSRGVFE